MTRIFHWFFMWKMDPMSSCNIRLVFTLPPRDSTLQYKRCVHFWKKLSLHYLLGLNSKMSSFLTWKWQLKKLCLCNIRFRTDFLVNSENHLTSFISNYTYLTLFPLWRLILFFVGFLFWVWRFPSNFPSAFGNTFVLFST